METLFAATGLAVCLAMLFRLSLNPSRKRKLDQLAAGLVSLLLYLPRKMRAARGAAEAIRRAKDRGSWEGNVYTPKSFKRPRKPH